MGAQYARRGVKGNPRRMRAGMSFNGFFRMWPENERAGRDMARPAHTRRTAMLNHLFLLPRIILIIDLKVKIRLMRK
jgi:hypothetical protein